MGFDGIFLHKLKQELEIIKTGRITKINEITPTSFIFVIRANKENYNLYLNFNSDNSRIQITRKPFNHVTNPKAFTLFLKKNLEGFFISDITQYETDRIITFTCEGFNEMRDRTKLYLICEVMGRYSNLIITDENNTILDCLHKDGVGEFNRIIMPYALYKYPVIEKLNPYKVQASDFAKLNINNPKDLVNNFLGLSNTFGIMCFKDDNIYENFQKLLNDLYKPSIFTNINGKKDYYFYSDEPLMTYTNLSELLDELFYENSKAEQIKRETSDITKFINRQINKFTTKLKKLDQDKNEALDCDMYKLYGELLLSAPNLKEKQRQITLLNYYTNENVTINLDEKIDILANSQKYYKKYQKLKKSLQFIEEQKQIAQDELDYFNLLQVQIATSNLNDILEIEEELTKYKYLMPKNNKPKKKQKPNILTYDVDGTYIYVGKNNLQNEYITHTLAKANNLWFHVENASGSHVVIAKDDNFTENEIRTAAQLAAYFSYYQNSSSVPVAYTKVRYIKKIPGKRACFVTYTNQKTIYIDPDKNYINNLKIKKG